jgi:hypothetical protein
MDAMFALERSLSGLLRDRRRKEITPLVNDLIEWMKWERAIRHSLASV